MGDRLECPACFAVLPEAKAGEVLKTCPHCGYELPPEDDLQRTAAHTPLAKRRPSRPSS